MISKTVDSTTFNFGRLLELSMRGKKPAWSKSCQISIATDLCKVVFNRFLLKTAKNGHFETLF